MGIVPGVSRCLFNSELGTRNGGGCRLRRRHAARNRRTARSQHPHPTPLGFLPRWVWMARGAVAESTYTAKLLAIQLPAQLSWSYATHTNGREERGRRGEGEGEQRESTQRESERERGREREREGERERGRERERGGDGGRERGTVPQKPSTQIRVPWKATRPSSSYSSQGQWTTLC